MLPLEAICSSIERDVLALSGANPAGGEGALWPDAVEPSLLAELPTDDQACLGSTSSGS